MTTKKVKIGRGYYQSGYGRGYKHNVIVWLIEGKAYVKDSNAYPFETDLPGYVMVNQMKVNDGNKFYSVGLIIEHILFE